MRSRRLIPPRFVLAAVALAWATPVAAQENPLASAEGGAEAEARASKLETLREQNAALAKRAAEWEAKASEYERARREAPERLSALEAEIEALAESTPDAVDRDAEPEQLEVLLVGAEQDVSLAQGEVSELGAELDRRAERRRRLPERLADAKERRAAHRTQPTPPAAASPELAEARARHEELLGQALDSEVRAYEQELLSFDARGELLARRLVRAKLVAARADARQAALRDALVERRESEAERAAERALDSLEEAASLSPGVRDTVRRLAIENAELARSRTGEEGLLEAIEDTTRKLQNADRRVAEIDADYERLVERVESSGLTDSVGLLLRKTRQDMPDVGMYRRFIRLRRERIAEAEARQEGLRDELEALSDLDGLVEASVARLAAEAPEGDPRRLEALLRDLLETKRKHLAALLGDYETYFQRLVDFDARQQQLVERTEALLRYVDQRILWIPSGSALRPRLLRQAAPALEWLATPRYWGQLGRALVATVVDAPLTNLLALAVLAAALPLLRRSRPRQAALAAAARQSLHTQIRQTVESVALALLRAPWGPAALAWVGWRLAISPDATQFVRCIAYGLLGAALVWLSLEIPRRILEEDGPAEAHFAWPAAAVRALHRDLGWLVGLSLPLVFGIRVFEMRGEDDWRESVGRACLIALLAAVAFFTHRIAREGGPLREILRATRVLGVDPWWRAVHLASLAVPLALAAAAARGYYWTGLQLAASYHLTLVFLFALLVLLSLAMRWALVARRRLAFEQWEKARAAREAESGAGDATGEQPVVAEPEMDLATVDTQTGRLLSTSALLATVLGLWFLWADLVPAVGVLDGFELWSTTESHSVELVDADGTSSIQTVDRVVPVTLANLFVAALIAVMTLVLVRNLPGLLEISLYRRLGTQTGERYAYSTIAKYAITLVGGVLAFGAVGIGWSNIQWLVAAVGLGLGFGLQEIFANFVSGLIILFERPIRVGDTVTVGEVSGTVSKIRIRATWITGFDRKELVVPNKEFVTNQLVNWSLTDPVLRVDLKVGIAYGSDTERAMRELLAVAEANANVLPEPKPQVFFLGFGDSSLSFELRCFSPDVEHRLQILHELHLGVDRAFRAAGIEIAFPQRDLHLRSLPEPSGAASVDAGD